MIVLMKMVVVSSVLDYGVELHSNEESLQRKKVECSSLPNAIFLATWKSLALTAIFAGVKTLASFMGPLLITHFVNYLLGKSDDSSNRDGLILAFFFFFAKTAESLTQRELLSDVFYAVFYEGFYLL
ncbi:putative ABC transporter C family member 15 [Cucumis melo var. makuwa]|uniref:ABC transporter C family member 15 n=1 Tax=Cucumis melo var. makuwa TaxID=1194695 RepID=A0A5A7SU94_CUCMM|nr:putative ABC transporter C family member 15 [Cucumis melo var. makuwa]